MLRHGRSRLHLVINFVGTLQFCDDTLWIMGPYQPPSGGYWDCHGGDCTLLLLLVASFSIVSDRLASLTHSTRCPQPLPSPCTRPAAVSMRLWWPISPYFFPYFFHLFSFPRNITLVLRAAIQIRLGTDEWDSGIITPNIKKTCCTHLKNVYLFMYANVLSNGCNFRESFSKVILFYL